MNIDLDPIGGALRLHSLYVSEHDPIGGALRLHSLYVSGYHQILKIAVEHMLRKHTNRGYHQQNCLLIRKQRL